MPLNPLDEVVSHHEMQKDAYLQTNRDTEQDLVQTMDSQVESRGWYHSGEEEHRKGTNHVEYLMEEDRLVKGASMENVKENDHVILTGLEGVTAWIAEGLGATLSSHSSCVHKGPWIGINQLDKLYPTKVCSHEG